MNLKILYGSNKIPTLANSLKILLLFLILFHQSSCRKLVDIPPPTNSITENSVFSTDATSIPVLTGIYTTMNSNGQPFQGTRSVSLLTGLSSDELRPIGGVGTLLEQYYQNKLSATGAVAGPELWSPLYSLVYRCNAALEGLNKTSSLTHAVKQQLMGEAKFLRGFFYFYLVNIFGDVPLIVTTDPKVNTLQPRSNSMYVYQQIEADLTDAVDLLSSTYLKEGLLSSGTERIRPTKWAATALLARVYLFRGNYYKAEEKATSLINQESLFSLVSLNQVFLKNSREAIWQLQPTSIYFNTLDAQTFVFPASGLSTTNRPVYMNDMLLNAFEPGDQRAISGNWINSRIIGGTNYYFPFKYKLNTQDSSITQTTGTTNMKEYFMILRLGEQYLIRSEARARLGNITGARDDLNAIRIRAGLNLSTATNESSLHQAILNERKVELFTELGHRWFDLKRTNNLNSVMQVATPLKANGTSWQTYQQLYPLPQGDLDKAPNLVQNSGY